jgi:hypothetical protein
VRRRPHGQWTFRECPIIIYNNRPARPSPQYLSGRWVKKAWPVQRKRAGAASAGSVAVIASAVRRLSIGFSPVLWPGPSQPVNADKSASQSKPAAALPTNSSASRQYTRSISIDLCRVWSQILSKETPRFTALVTSPDRRLWAPKADTSKPSRAAPFLTMLAMQRPCSRSALTSWLRLFQTRLKTAPSVMSLASIHAFSAATGHAVEPRGT